MFKVEVVLTGGGGTVPYEVHYKSAQHKHGKPEWAEPPIDLKSIKQTNNAQNGIDCFPFHYLFSIKTWPFNVTVSSSFYYILNNIEFGSGFNVLSRNLPSALPATHCQKEESDCFKENCEHAEPLVNQRWRLSLKPEIVESRFRDRQVLWVPMTLISNQYCVPEKVTVGGLSAARSSVQFIRLAFRSWFLMTKDNKTTGSNCLQCSNGRHLTLLLTYLCCQRTDVTKGSGTLLKSHNAKYD